MDESDLPAVDLLARLASLSDAAYEELLAVPAEHALERLQATSVSLSRWERDRGVLRCVVNVGELAPGEVRFPVDEVYELSEWDSVVDLKRGHGSAYELDDPDLPEPGRRLLVRLGHRSAVSVPVYLGDRLWGELWATKRSERLSPHAIEVATHVAAEVSGMIALAERLEQMARLAFQDPLTGLGNRRQLDDTLHLLLAQDSSGATVVVCDVNDLKRVNDEFALLLPGSQRTTAIVTVEAAARTLGAATPPVTISCGIAVVSAGASARDALSVADAAQYSAKRRGALLFVAAGLQPGSGAPRRRFRDRPEAALAGTSTDVTLATARAISHLSDDLGDAPDTASGKLVWLAERLLTCFDLDHWSLSNVDLSGDRSLVITSMGLREGRPIEDAATDLHIDRAFPLADYPLTERAVTENGWFAVDTEDDLADPAERAVVTALGKRYVVALGCSEGTEGLLLELYGRGGSDVHLLGATMSLAAGALLGRPMQRLDATSVS